VVPVSTGSLKDGEEAGRQQMTELRAVPQLDPLVHKLLGHALRQEILIRLSDRPASPSQLAREMRETVERISDQIKVLRKYGAVELLEERTGRRGSIEHIYGAVICFMIDAAEWEALPEITQASSTATITKTVIGEWLRSLESGAFYSDPSHVLIRRPMPLDKQGREEMDALLCETDRKAFEIQRRSVERQQVSDEKPLRVVNVLASFPAAPEDSAAGRPLEKSPS
jgi:DNA-binding transcriptional ArsR family regulator